MVGSSNSIADANIMLDAAVASVLRSFADELEKASDFNEALHDLIRRTYAEHKRIVFNGNGYDDKWIEEATKVRGLSNYQTTPDALIHLLDPKNVAMLTSVGVFTETELRSRREICFDNYCKTVDIEARTMVKMVLKDILPAISRYGKELCDTVISKEKLSIPARYEIPTLRELTKAEDLLTEKTRLLENALKHAIEREDNVEWASEICNQVLPLMSEIRKASDEAENVVARKYWPFPTYGDLFYSVH